MGDFKANSQAKTKLPQGDLLFGHSAIVCHAILWVQTNTAQAQAQPGDCLNTVNGEITNEPTTI